MLTRNTWFYFVYVGAISPTLFIVVARYPSTFLLVLPLYLVHVAAFLQLELLVEKRRRRQERKKVEKTEWRKGEVTYTQEEALRTLNRIINSLRQEHPEACRQKGAFRQLFVSEDLAKVAWPGDVPEMYQSYGVNVVRSHGARATIWWRVPEGDDPDDGGDDDEGEDGPGDEGEASPDTSGSYPVSEIRELARTASEKKE